MCHGMTHPVATVRSTSGSRAHSTTRSSWLIARDASGGSCLCSSLIDLTTSIAGEFFGSDVILVDARLDEHRSQPVDHATDP